MDVPRGRLRKYLSNVLKGPFVNFRVPPPTQDDVHGAEYIFEMPFSQSALLDAAPLHHARTDDWDGMLHTTPDARALTYPRLTVKGSACVEIQRNHICDGQVGDTVGSCLTSACIWGYKAGGRLSAHTMRSPPEDWRVDFRGRTFLRPYRRSESVRCAGFPARASGR